MEKFSKKFPKFLNVMSYISITFGYLAMVGMVALLIENVIILAEMPKIITAPPIMPVIPYAPQIFNIPSLPNFYFIHWIIILAIMAITHEFAHGIFARFNKIKLKSTGFGFFGPLPLAFVELDEKQMARKKKKAQLAVLSGGSFSNFLFFIIFGLIFLLILSVSFHVTTPLYAATMINTSEIKNITLGQNTYLLNEMPSLNLEKANLPEKIILCTENQTLILTRDLLLEEKNILIKPENQTLIAYYNSPLINANIQGEILEIDGIAVKDKKIFTELQKTLPYQEIEIKTTKGRYTLIADKNPSNSSRGFIGLSYRSAATGTLGSIQDFFTPMKNPFMNYEPFNKEVYSFISLLFFWLIMLLFAIATFNMLPVGFLDGGKFFYLSMLAITKSKKKAEISYKIASALVGLIIFAMVLVWVLRMWVIKG